MQHITLRLLVAISTFLIGICAVTLWFILPKYNASFTPPSNESQPADHGSMIIEASVYYGGMYSYVGEMLDLRVYESGYAEYEVLNGSKPVRKSAALNANELKELVGLSNQTDILNAKKEYPAFIYGVDTYEIETITFTHEGGKKVIVVRNPSLTDPRATSNYPPSLIDLLRKIKQIRERL